MLEVESVKRYIGPEHAAETDALLANCEQSKLKSLKFKNPTIALILSIFLGFLGIDRLYQGGPEDVFMQVGYDRPDIWNLVVSRYLF